MKVSAAIISHAQVWTFTLALLGFLALLFALVFRSGALEPTVKEIVSAMLNVLGTLLAGMSAYFFSRQRPDSSTPPQGGTS